MFLPELFLWSLILPQQTQDFFCIHSEPFFWVPWERKRLQSKIFWRARWKTLAKAGKITFTVQPNSSTTLCQLSRVIGHHFTYHLLGHLVHKRRSGQWKCGFWWMSVLSKLGLTIEACKVISHGAMYVLMPSCMFYCQITALAQIICSTTPTHKGLTHKKTLLSL